MSTYNNQHQPAAVYNNQPVGYNNQPNTFHGQAAAPEKGARHWVGYGLIAASQALTALTWFAIMVATVSLQNSQYIPAANGQQGTYFGLLPTIIGTYMIPYCFRMICIFASLVVTYNADRYFMSRGAAWASWVVNLLLLFSWLSIDLPVVYSAFSWFNYGANTNQPGSQPLNSNRTKFCSLSANGYCDMSYANAVMSIVADFLIGCTFLYACYQMARARSNILLTWSEVACINLTALGICGYLCWTLANIRSAYSFDPRPFNFIPVTSTFENVLIHGAFIFSLGSAALVSFGATKASRMTALLLNWLSFFLIFPTFLFMARHQNEGSAGQCASDHYDGAYLCPTMDAITAGLGIAAAANFLLGFDLMAVYAQPERADFAVAKGVPELATGPRGYDNINTRPPTPTASGVVTQPIQTSSVPMHSVATNNMQVGQPVYRNEVNNVV